MNGPTATLRSEHESVKAILSLLQALAAALGAGRPVPEPDLRKALDAAGRTDGRHHAKEERVLFPALVRASPRDAPALVERLRAQHAEDRTLAAEMALHAPGALRGERAEVAAFGQAAGRYARRVSDHLAEEEATLLPLADRVLGPASRRAVSIAFEAVEAQAAAGRPDAELRRDVGELAARYGSAPAAA